MKEASKITRSRSTIAAWSASTRALVGRPDLMAGRTSLTVYEADRDDQNVFINAKNRSHAITALVEIPANGPTA